MLQCYYRLHTKGLPHDEHDAAPPAFTGGRSGWHRIRPHGWLDLTFPSSFFRRRHVSRDDALQYVRRYTCRVFATNDTCRGMWERTQQHTCPTGGSAHFAASVLASVPRCFGLSKRPLLPLRTFCTGLRKSAERSNPQETCPDENAFKPPAP